MVDDGLLGKILDKLFSLAGAIYVALCMVAVHWSRARNERLRDTATEKAGDWVRLRDERDRALARNVVLEAENIALRKENVELLGRAVIAEAENIGRDKAEGKPTMLTGSSGMPQLPPPSNGGDT